MNPTDVHGGSSERLVSRIVCKMTVDECLAQISADDVVKDVYKRQERNGMYYIIPSSAPECPHCGGAMTVRDSKRRKLILSDGTVQMFVLRRYKCKICGRIHLNLPDIMLPHKHYAREAIIETVRGERNCSAEQSTIYRWNREKLQLECQVLQMEKEAEKMCIRDR